MPVQPVGDACAVQSGVGNALSRDVTLLVDGPYAFSTPVARCTGLAEAVSSVGIGDAQELTW